jgi:hypothetical protein
VAAGEGEGCGERCDQNESSRSQFRPRSEFWGVRVILRSVSSSSLHPRHRNRAAEVGGRSVVGGREYPHDNACA